MITERASLTGASMRVVLAVFAIVLLPFAYPAMLAQWPLLAGYAALALVALLLIHRGLATAAGGAIAVGAVDMGVLSWLIHRTGSSSSMLLAIYLLASILNVLAVGRAVGLTMAGLASASYGAIVAAEQLGVLPHAPDAPMWMGRERPTALAALTGWVLVSVLTLLATTVVGRLVARILVRERELEATNAELAAANRRLQELSQRDPLTELYNRRHLMQIMDRELSRVRRGGAAAVAMLDLDGFKRVNDSFGHLRGDALLQEIAAGVARSMRVVDVVGRYGGDEFLVIMPDTDAEQARVAANRLVQSVKAEGMRFDPTQPVTASVGVTVACPEDEVRPLVQRADKAAYAAKQAGGDRVLLVLADASATPTPPAAHAAQDGDAGRVA